MCACLPSPGNLCTCQICHSAFVSTVIFSQCFSVLLRVLVNGHYTEIFKIWKAVLASPSIHWFVFLLRYLLLFAGNMLPTHCWLYQHCAYFIRLLCASLQVCQPFVWHNQSRSVVPALVVFINALKGTTLELRLSHLMHKYMTLFLSLRKAHLWCVLQWLCGSLETLRLK